MTIWIGIPSSSTTPSHSLSLSPLCDLGALWLGRRAGHHLAYGLLVLGVLSATAAVLSGNAAATEAWDGPAAEPLATHESLATWTLLLGLGAVLGRLPLHLKGRLDRMAALCVDCPRFPDRRLGLVDGLLRQRIGLCPRLGRTSRWLSNGWLAKSVWLIFARNFFTPAN